MTTSAQAAIRAEIEAEGPISFARFVDFALYDPQHGFYAGRGQAGGRRGDFITSVEVGPLFAAVVGDWLDRQWQDQGEPDPFLVAEAGAGVGTLFRGLNRSQPACFDALQYTLAEQSAGLRESHGSLPGTGWRSAPSLPPDQQHVVIANELLDNLPFAVAERTSSGWTELAVDESLELITHGPAELSAQVAASLRSCPLGTRVPVAAAARGWVQSALDRTTSLLIFDYGASTAELAARGQSGWLRTYAGHERGADPFDGVGGRDITCDVPFDQLPAATRQVSQAKWLIENGIEARVAAAKTVWQERAHIGDLTAIAARSAIGEAEALTDVAGLGAFQVLEWSRR